MAECPGSVRYARCGTPKQDWSLFERCSKETTRELLEIERLTSSLERGHWKSTRKGNSLVAYSTACAVLRGGKCRKAPTYPKHLTPGSGGRWLGTMSVAPAQVKRDVRRLRRKALKRRRCRS